MAFRLAVPLGYQFEDANGDPLSGGSIEFYLTGTSTPTPIYFDSAGSASATSVTLNSLGNPQTSGGTAAELYFDTGIIYKLIRKDSAGTEIPPTFDPFQAPNVAGSESAWVLFSGTPTQTSATTFTVTGDQTSTFQEGTRVKADDASTLYMTVGEVAYTTLTTVTIAGATLTGSLSAVYTSIAAVDEKPISANATAWYPDWTGAQIVTVDTRFGKAVLLSDASGSDSTGATSSSTALDNCIDQAFSQKIGVHIPDGDWFLDSSAELQAQTNDDKRYGTWIIGNGHGANILGDTGITIFKGISTGPTSPGGSPGDLFDFCGLFDLQIRSKNSASKASIGFDISEMTRIFCSNVLFRQLDYGVRQTRSESPNDECWTNQFMRCFFQECDEWGLSTESIYNFLIFNCVFESSATSGGGISLTDDTTLSPREYRNFTVDGSCTFQNLYRNAIRGGAGLNLNIKNSYFEECALGGSGSGYSYEIDLTKGNRDTTGDGGFIENLSIEGNTFNSNATNIADSNFYNVGVEKIRDKSKAYGINYSNCPRRVEVTNSTTSDILRVDANLTSTEVSTGSAIVYGIDDGFQYGNASHIQKSAVGKAFRQIQKSDSRELTIGHISSKPSTSDHRQGSIYYNEGYTAATPFGWSCIAEGSPDTWKTLLVGARGTTTERDALSLGTDDEGAIFDNETTATTQRWTGSAWQNI